MNFAEKAFIELFPDKHMPKITYRYSGKFGLYGANVKRRWSGIQFGLSKTWKEISEPIKIGLAQNLLCKLYKAKKNTVSMDLYEGFTKNIHLSIPKIKSEPLLENSFNRINEKYFNGLIEKPNLCWGSLSRKTLGTYNYHNDTINISKIFKNAPKIFIDYVMYHETLHKKIKFYKSGTKNYHHTKKFRDSEKQFQNQKIVEKELKAFLRKQIPKQKKKWWFV
ncbi:SprT-like domain-containing protein [Candidatus Woesearchaeota archaeon]|nr:SprT-like domain-containing protein [Candidatus Woesearchaeota archaeon]